MICSPKLSAFLLLLAALLLSFSVFSWAEVCFSDEDYQELTEIFDELGSINAQREKQIETLETGTTQLETALTISETATQESEKALEKSEKALEISEQETAEAQDSLTGVESSLEKERKATRVNLPLAAIIALAIGIGIGLLF